MPDTLSLFDATDTGPRIVTCQPCRRGEHAEHHAGRWARSDGSDPTECHCASCWPERPHTCSPDTCGNDADHQDASPTPAGDATARRLALARQLWERCGENRLTLAARTLQRALRAEKVARTATERDADAAEIADAIEYARDELAGMRDQLEDDEHQDDEKRTTAAAVTADPDRLVLLAPRELGA